MECREAEELLVPYLLGALDSSERESLSSHLDSCPDCSLKLDGDGETMTRLATSVPRWQAPPRVKQRLFSRIEASRLHPGRLELIWRGIRHLLASQERLLLAQTVRAAASVLVLGLVFGGVWLNARVNHISDENRQLEEKIEVVAQENMGLSEQLQSVAQREIQVMDMLMTQRYLTYEAMRMSATPGTSVNMLSGTGWTAEARGMMMVSRTGAEALLLAINLPPLPPDKVYQVWLTRDGRRYNGGLFSVDSTGYGQTVIIPYVSIAEFEAIRITIEPAGGSADPTGTSVLRGDL